MSLTLRPIQPVIFKRKHGLNQNNPNKRVDLVAGHRPRNILKGVTIFVTILRLRLLTDFRFLNYVLLVPFRTRMTSGKTEGDLLADNESLCSLNVIHIAP